MPYAPNDLSSEAHTLQSSIRHVPLQAIETVPVARYQFNFIVDRPIRTNEYAGSALRGAFGHALLKATCMTKMAACSACPLITTCAYPKIFKPVPPPMHRLQRFSDIPVGYIIEPPDLGRKIYATGEIFTFTMVLIGAVRAYLPLIIYAWQRAFAHEIGGGTAILQDVLVCNTRADADQPVTAEAIYYNNAVVDHTQHTCLPVAAPHTADGSTYTIQIVTPLRLQDDGHALATSHLTPHRLFMALIKRATLIFEFHADTVIEFDLVGLKSDSAAVKDEKKLTWMDWQRYSSRQKQTMKLGGVIGEWIFSDVSPQLAHLLAIGELIHTGKNTSFGMGRYYLHAAGS